MSSSDGRRNDEPKEAEDLELEDEQSEGVQGGFAPAESKVSVAKKASSTSTTAGAGTGPSPLKQI